MRVTSLLDDHDHPVDTRRVTSLLVCHDHPVDTRRVTSLLDCHEHPVDKVHGTSLLDVYQFIYLIIMKCQRDISHIAYGNEILRCVTAKDRQPYRFLREVMVQGPVL